MAMDTIRIRGARTHNLKNINLDLPRDRLIVITGLSGSGKSSLAFDTIYAEGQRRYVESLSANARQFLSVKEKPDVDHIEGLSPAIAIEQKSTSHNPRSTVGTITEIYDYLRLLYARVGTPRCPDHGYPLEAQTVSQMVDQVMALANDPARAEQRWMLLAPVIRERKGEHAQVFEQLRAQGFVRVRVDGALYEIDAVPPLALRVKHTIEAVIDRFKVREDLKQRLAESFETALKLGDGMAQVQSLDDSGTDESRVAPLLFSSKYSCPVCDYSLPELEPRLFSFNSPVGACPTCDGLGVSEFFDPARVVVHPELSLAAGAVRGWDRRNAYYFQLIASLARHYGFSVDTHWQDLDENVRQAVLYGSGKELIGFTYLTDAGGRSQRRHKFEGILPNLERRYRETESAAVREELAKYVSERPCVDCGGARLNRNARNVFVADTALPQIAVLHRRGTELLRPAAAAGLAGRDRGQDRQGNRRPAAVPGRCRSRLPDPGTQGRQPFRRRGPADSPGLADRCRTGRRPVRARRTIDRPAPARQRATARHPHSPARSRQHRDRGRA